MTDIIRIPYPPRGILNSYLLRGERTIVVDTGFPGATERILQALREHGIGTDEVSLILITHGHVDHLGSAAALRRELGVPTAIHPADAIALERGEQLWMEPTRIMGHVFRRLPAVQAMDLEPAAADVLLEEGATLERWGVSARVVHTPGHTPGSITLLTDRQEVVAGDFVISGLMGFDPKRPARSPFHHDFGEGTRSIERVLALEPRRIWIGHGGPLEPARLRRWLHRNRWHWDRRARRAGLTRP